MAYNIYVDWNDFDALAEVFEENRDQIAALSDEDIRETIEIAGEGFAALKER